MFTGYSSKSYEGWVEGEKKQFPFLHLWPVTFPHRLFVLKFWWVHTVQILTKRHTLLNRAALYLICISLPQPMACSLLRGSIQTEHVSYPRFLHAGQSRGSASEDEVWSFPSVMLLSIQAHEKDKQQLPADTASSRDGDSTRSQHVQNITELVLFHIPVFCAYVSPVISHQYYPTLTDGDKNESCPV